MLERALDMLDCALLIVDRDHKVEYGNRAASELLLNGYGGLSLDEARLGAKSEDLSQPLAEAIRLACVDLQPSGVCRPEAGVPAERWLRLVVAPVHFGGTGRAAVWIVNTESPASPSEELLAALFGLSRAEARLAVCVLLGRSAAQCARQFGVGVSTIRSQLRSIFSKTGVRRQAQLVALLARVPTLQLSGRP